MELDVNLPSPPAQNEFLRSGRHLSAADTELMKQEAAKTDALLNGIGREIGDMWEMLASLENAERMLQDLRTTQQAYLAPIRRLPPEVLSEIFKLYCGDPCTDITLKHCPPLVLGSVCKSWRGTLSLGIVTAKNGNTTDTQLYRYYTRHAPYMGEFPSLGCVSAHPRVPPWSFEDVSGKLGQRSSALPGPLWDWNWKPTWATGNTLRIAPPIRTVGLV